MFLSRLARVLLALTAGLALWVAFPSHDQWWAAPFGVAALSAATCSVRARTGFALGFLAGLACFLPTLSWSGVYVGAVPWCALAVLEALYFGALGLFLALVQRRGIAPVSVACAWVTQEWLRSTTPFGGFPWARLAFSQADAPWAPLVRFVSTPGLTFVITLSGATVAALAQPVFRRLLRRRVVTPFAFPHRGLVIGAVGVSALALIVGSCITPPTSGRRLQVAAVQGNVPTAGLDFNAQRRAVLDNHVAATRQYAHDVEAGRSPRPDIVIWPENSSDIDPKRNRDAGVEISGVVDEINVPTMVGAVLAEPMPDVSNASMLYLPHRGLVAQYVKQHPVPFGEYIPYRSFFRTFSSKVDLVRADFTKGKRTGVFAVPTRAGTVKVAPVICFEVAYDDLVRKPVLDGAQLLAVQTNNATFGYTDESAQQLAISRIRALEYGRSVVHVSTVGISAFITPDGAEHDTSSLFSRKVLTGALPLRSDTTLATRLGRAPEIVCAVVVCLALLMRCRTSRGTRKSSSPAER